MTAAVGERRLSQPEPKGQIGRPTSEATPGWLGAGLEMLVERFPEIDSAAPRAAEATPQVDVVIVGSGYGASIAAHGLAGCTGPDGRTLSVCILERGAEYPRGAFPSRLSELPGHIRFSTPAQPHARGLRGGLFDLRFGPDAMAVVANGVGGGSLINAGVMLKPSPEVLQWPCWPKAIRRDPAALDAHFDTVSEWLGARTSDGQPNDVATTGFDRLLKTESLGRLSTAEPVPITVALRPRTSTYAGVPLERCVSCGDCATGCNHGAKISLDIGLLPLACNTPGVKLYTGATVLRLERHPNGWLVVVQHTDAQLRRRQGPPFRLHAQRVILAAGTFGSTEILLRSRRRGLALSTLLGSCFSANGDLIASIYQRRDEVNAVADEAKAPPSRHVGPTITAMVDRRDHAGRDGYVIQDLAVPGPLRRSFEELFSTANTLHALQDPDLRRHAARDPDPCAIDPGAIKNSLPVAMIGHDGANGLLQLTEDLGPGAIATATTGPIDDDDEGDGGVQIHWPGMGDNPRWARQHAELAELALRGGGRVLPNPAWQLLPAAMAQELGVPNGPMITVHPLGGCPMGDDRDAGVVDQYGRVFDGRAVRADDVHPGLVVLDGSIVPTSLGVNPSLTIAALAHRAMPELRNAWGLSAPHPSTTPAGARPVFRILPDPTPPQATEIELIERMRGMARLEGDPEPHCIELTLYSRPTPLPRLMQRDSPRELQFDPARSQVRVLRGALPSTLDEPAPDAVLLEANLGGTLTVFTRRPSGWAIRALRAIAAWLINRGVRDIVQARRAKKVAPSPPAASSGWLAKLRRLWHWGRDLFALATHAGTQRELHYRLCVDATHMPPRGPLKARFKGGQTVIEGRKTLAYECAANPLQQLMDMTLTQFPLLPRKSAPVLALHLPFLAARGVPLLRIVRQEDQPSALVDFASFLGYVTRTLIDGHLWSFRKPDALPPRASAPQRLPGRIDGAPPPDVTEIEVARIRRGHAVLPVRIRLTRYLPRDPAVELPPVLMIHGYSASGTTFAHPTLEPGLMKHLTGEHRRDVWILDMRSSCGMPTANEGWVFEDMGYEDIPVAVDHLCRVTGHPQIDLVAHCMGVAMLFMGLLGVHDPSAKRQHETARAALPQRIRRLVMSQVGPAVLLTPANVARAYLMRYVKQFVIGGGYEFRPERPEALNEQLLDRLLCALPYPRDEFERENPFWPPGQVLPWVSTRHRIDALFGQVFKLANMSPATLACIDDFFGPFNVDTVSQAMNFARHRMITDRYGFNRYVVPSEMRRRLRFAMLSLHAAENGLADAGTQAMLDAVLAPNLGPGGSLDQEPFEGLGHQDSLIGTRAATAPVFDRIATFLQSR